MKVRRTISEGKSADAMIGREASRELASATTETSNRTEMEGGSESVLMSESVIGSESGKREGRRKIENGGLDCTTVNETATADGAKSLSEFTAKEWENDGEAMSWTERGSGTENGGGEVRGSWGSERKAADWRQRFPADGARAGVGF
jgi:hypothetical protein